MLIGVDLDHTIIDYRSLIYQEALKKDLIDKNHPQDKNSIKHTLKKRSEECWREFQSEIYGKKIGLAHPYLGVETFFSKISNKDLVIVSHKTKWCYKKRYLLQEEAKSWLREQSFFSDHPLFFASSLKEKCQTINEMGCTHFVDDLPEVLETLSPSTCKILFDPKNLHPKNPSYIKCSSWKEIIKSVCDG